ncbi:hypothetical protein Aasi_1533 [Candidatus Amoebophilus asiaticus 5a2]|uniref:Uncharacterized protein n=1 Tax=Amoebophilus asiaticus (strain 5a2) TaxID=452471 RepID=C3L4G8_AMOA5|nr:hypothetical protein Aasi_1533 [Candidatus Amoebophilus asiaticus 5a2]
MHIGKIYAKYKIFIDTMLCLKGERYFSAFNDKFYNRIRRYADNINRSQL